MPPAARPSGGLTADSDGSAQSNSTTSLRTPAELSIRTYPSVGSVRSGMPARIWVLLQSTITGRSFPMNTLPELAPKLDPTIVITPPPGGSSEGVTPARSGPE